MRVFVEVISTCRGYVAIRIPVWSETLLVYMPCEKMRSKSFSQSPARGVVYSVEANLEHDGKRIDDFAFKRWHEEGESPGSSPLPAPGAVPGPGEALPVGPDRNRALATIIRESVCEPLSKDSLCALVYLVNRAHALGQHYPCARVSVAPQLPAAGRTRRTRKK